jgi:hypothetical protein
MSKGPRRNESGINLAFERTVCLKEYQSALRRDFHRKKNGKDKLNLREWFTSH